ncbi:SpoIIE family protein phosphatase [Streptomyces sp. NPDC046859]|uniref:ATP-binding SpoIIE family protein phosphatase n=1 Tax=Streptomyces sp. NPDC046859 TaxID=3155734 RepID=UPI0033D62EB1
MDSSAGQLLSRAAQELGRHAGELSAEVEQCLRRELPALYETPDVARAVSQSIFDHITAALSGLERQIEASRIELPAADTARSLGLARHGIPLSTVLRAFRLAQAIVNDRLLEELPLLSGDAQQVSAAARALTTVSTTYVDRVSEQGVEAFQEERDRRLRWRSRLVNEASMRIGTTLDIDRTVQELADLAAERLADVVTVDLLDPLLRGEDAVVEMPFLLRRMAQVPADAEGPEPGVRPQEVHHCRDGSATERALVTGRPSRHQHDRSEDPRGIHSTLVVPLRARGTTLGLAEFHRGGTPVRYDDEDLLVAEEIAARAAVAVDNARRYTHARATALTLQRSLLPRNAPQQSAVDVAYRYLPAGSDAGVGGDWYDVIPLSGARVALVVGDVVGHGIRAAATMGRLRTAVRTLADIDLPPDELLTHLNDVVLRLSAEESGDQDGSGDGDIGATCLYAVYDPVSRRCTLARAGHVPPAVVVCDGRAELLDLPPGPPLGLGGLPFETVEIDLPEGSLIALCTDGLIEAFAHGAEAGLAALREVLARPAPSLDAACDTVLAALLPSTKPDDDIALLLACTHALGADRVATWDLEPDPSEVARARGAVSRQLAAWGLGDIDFIAELVVSELVTNAIRYGRAPISLRLIHDRGLLLEVSDASSTTPHLRRARVFDEGGRGLLLVAQLAEQWGTRHARHGKTVWAQLSETAELPPPIL